jgi:hypothetical protein
MEWGALGNLRARLEEYVRNDGQRFSDVLSKTKQRRIKSMWNKMTSNAHLFYNNKYKIEIKFRCFIYF